VDREDSAWQRNAASLLSSLDVFLQHGGAYAVYPLEGPPGTGATTITQWAHSLLNQRG